MVRYEFEEQKYVSISNRLTAFDPVSVARILPSLQLHIPMHVMNLIYCACNLRFNTTANLPLL